MNLEDRIKNRQIALDQAIRMAMAERSGQNAEEITKNAETYLAFLNAEEA